MMSEMKLRTWAKQQDIFKTRANTRKVIPPLSECLLSFLMLTLFIVWYQTLKNKK